jgi:anti-sigma factor RsiW
MCYHPTSMFENEHPFKDELEAYALGRTAAEDLERIETHLLLCERCQSEVLHIDEYCRAIRRTAASLRNGSKAEAFRMRDRRLASIPATIY